MNEHWKGELDLELTQLDSLSTQLDGAVKKLEEIGKKDRRIIRLRTIPGVRPRTAEILVACIDDPHRFENGRQVSAYFGLVPRQFQSGETDRNGRITKRSIVKRIGPRCFLHTSFPFTNKRTNRVHRSFSPPSTRRGYPRVKCDHTSNSRKLSQ